MTISIIDTSPSTNLNFTRLQIGPAAGIAPDGAELLMYAIPHHQERMQSITGNAYITQSNMHSIIFFVRSLTRRAPPRVE